MACQIYIFTVKQILLLVETIAAVDVTRQPDTVQHAKLDGSEMTVASHAKTIVNYVTEKAVTVYNVQEGGTLQNVMIHVQTIVFRVIGNPVRAKNAMRNYGARTVIESAVAIAMRAILTQGVASHVMQDTLGLTVRSYVVIAGRANVDVYLVNVLMNARKVGLDRDVWTNAFQTVRFVAVTTRVTVVPQV